MSCFQGQMNEYKDVALDRFDGKNLKCTAYFLSHCHKDHMVGLNAYGFHERLKSRAGVYLYCTEISRLLLIADEEYKHLEKFITVLDVGISRHICVPGRGEGKDTYVSVTPISAGHCLGSVMFLFEGGEGTVLYTGDFRWEADQASRISAFQYMNNVKTVEAIYVDTTFCIPEAFHIPSRNECVDAACNLISDWLEKGLCNAVSISCPARYGHEHFLLELAKRLKTKVHVPCWKVSVYNNIPELQGYFTNDASQAKIHSCATRSGFTKTSVLPCGHQPSNGERLKLLNIRPSTMWFTSRKTKCGVRDLVVSPATQRGLHRVCYSMHSSYSEIRDLVSFIKPKKVFPNVLPASDKDMMTVQKRLESFIDHPNKHRLQASSKSKEEQVVIPLGILRQMKRKITNFSRAESLDSGSDDLVFSSQELSPKKNSTTPHHDNKTTTAFSTVTAALLSPDKTFRSSSKELSKSPTSHHDISEQSHSSSVEFHSSYSGSMNYQDDEESDLFSEEIAEREGKNLCEGIVDVEVEDNDKDVKKFVSDDEKVEVRDGSMEESLRSYVSGESDVEDCADDDKDDGKIIAAQDDRNQNISSIYLSFDKETLDTSNLVHDVSRNEISDAEESFLDEIDNQKSVSQDDDDKNVSSTSCNLNFDEGTLKTDIDFGHKSTDVYETDGKINGSSSVTNKCYDMTASVGDNEWSKDPDKTLNYNVTDSSFNSECKSDVKHVMNSKNGEKEGKKDAIEIITHSGNDTQVPLEGKGQDDKDEEEKDVQNSDNDDDDDNDDDGDDDYIIPNSQETCAHVKKRDNFQKNSRGKRYNIFLPKHHKTDEGSEGLNVVFDKKLGRGSDSKPLKDHNSYQTHGSDYVNSGSGDTDGSDTDCEILYEENSRVVMNTVNNDFRAVNKNCKDNMTFQRSQSGVNGGKKLQILDISRSHSQSDVVDVEQNEYLENDSDDCIEFVCVDEKSESVSPLKAGWLSKSNKRKIKNSNLSLSSSQPVERRATTSTSKSKVCDKRKRPIEGSEGGLWNSKLRRSKHRYNNVSGLANLGDGDKWSCDNRHNEEDDNDVNKEPVVDLTLEDSL